MGEGQAAGVRQRCWREVWPGEVCAGAGTRGAGSWGKSRARLREKDSLSLPGRAKVVAEGTRDRSCAGQHPGLGKVGVGRSELGGESGDLKRAPFSLHFLGTNFGSSRVPVG